MGASDSVEFALRVFVPLIDLNRRVCDFLLFCGSYPFFADTSICQPVKYFIFRILLVDAFANSPGDATLFNFSLVR